MKTAPLIAGFVLIFVGIFAMAGPTPLLGIHPIAWFIAAAVIFAAEPACEHLTNTRQKASGETDPSTAPNEGGTYLETEDETKGPGPLVSSEPTKAASASPAAVSVSPAAAPAGAAPAPASPASTPLGPTGTENEFSSQIR